MLYCTVKTGVNVNIADLGTNVLFDLITYATAIDAAALEKAEGKKGTLAAHLDVLGMLQKKGGKG